MSGAQPSGGMPDARPSGTPDTMASGGGMAGSGMAGAGMGAQPSGPTPEARPATSQDMRNAVRDSMNTQNK